MHRKGASLAGDSEAQRTERGANADRESMQGSEDGVLVKRLIEISTNKGDVVLDPFGGGGSTYEAAQRLGRYWLGSEITTSRAICERLRRHFADLGSGVPRRLMRVFTQPDADFTLRVP